MKTNYICPKPDCYNQRLLKESGTGDYICLVCNSAYTINPRGIPTLKTPLVIPKDTPKPQPRRQEESDMQQTVIAWAEKCNHKDILQYLHHSPNGGARSKSEGARFKREGVKAGYPDLELNVARRGYHGLFIELKTPKGVLSMGQNRWIYFLNEENNFVKICRSAEEAIKTIEWYLEE